MKRKKGNKTKILIVEDDKFLAELISTKLDKEGYDIVLANDGESGVTKTREEFPEIILLDIMLPGMDGFEVLENIKSTEKVKFCSSSTKSLI